MGKTLSNSIRQKQQQTLIGALLLYLSLALFMLAPLWTDDLVESPASDLSNHISGIIEARNALREGQFPIRVAPNQLDGSRYPFFQFYGNFPYTVGGLLFWVFGINPYTAWKVLVGGSLISGAFFVFKSAYAIVRRLIPAILAGTVYITAPYLATDIHARFAFPEIVSLGLLPPVFYFTYRSYISPSKWNRHIPLSALCWLFLLMSHPVTFLYSSMFIGVFFLSLTSFSKKGAVRLVRCGVGYGLAITMGAWYLVPQSILVPLLKSNVLISKPIIEQAYLTTLRVILAPTLVLPHIEGGFDNPRFGLQIGWPILLAFIGSIYYRFKSTNFLLSSSIITRWQLLFLLSTFMVWSPFDFWQYLPRISHYIQFFYRLLIFVVFFGALLAACTSLQFFKGRLAPLYLLTSILVLCLFVSPYLTPHKIATNSAVAQEIINPNVGRGGATVAYLLDEQILLRNQKVKYGKNYADWEYKLVSADGWLTTTVTTTLPAPKQGDIIHIEGVVPNLYERAPAMSLRFNHSLLFSSTLVKKGSFNLAVPVNMPIEGDLAQVEIFVDQYFVPKILFPGTIDKRKLSLRLYKFEYENSSSKYSQNFAKSEPRFVYSDGWVSPQASLILPNLQVGDVIHLTGQVPSFYEQPLKLSIGIGETVPIEEVLSGGPFEIEIPITNNHLSATQNPTKLSLVSNQSFIPAKVDNTSSDIRQLSLIINELTVKNAHQDIPIIETLLSIEKTRPQTNFGKVTSTIITPTQNSVAEIPVLYYPHVLSVYLDDVPTAYFNSGKFLAFDISPGQHVVNVEFVGITWANYVSLFGVMLTCLVALIPAFIRQRP